ncbi:hypothetical protein [Kineosporia babensis]|uniref:Uncharacterized protein n=1 Tax=Kineosporia babensis TaxID=499548 RepID=A0A9X1NNZ9_9ACTN|nr:hypothetical protein [Kineosporia babensis]MCD5317251.1 hypothetical protein [Kineosporia babensis]
MSPDPEQIMPTRADFQEQVFPDLVELVQSGWDFAPQLPGRGDYRQLWHSDLADVVYTVTVWRERPSGVLELRNIVIKPGPPADANYQDNDWDE